MITAFLWPRLRQNLVVDDIQHDSKKTEDGLLTVEQLAAFDGKQNKQLFLAILGSVFDVSKGAKHYGPDGTYNYFIGKCYLYLSFDERE